MSDLLKSMYSTYDILLGGRQPLEPSVKRFINWEEACQMIKDNFTRNGLFLIHGDVDVDGIFSAKEAYEWVCCFTTKDKVACCINTEKIHGISEKHVEVFSNVVGINGLVIILDSSTNMIDYIKKMRCNVLVVDHHEVTVPIEQLKGDTAGGKYVVVNNMIGPDAEPTMSGALVLYELLRMYQYKFLGGVDYLSAMKLYQYVGVTLFTDAIPLDTERNQWYINKTIESKELEKDLYKIVQSVNPYQHMLDKSFINYSLAPMINRGVREGLSPTVLNKVIYEPDKINELAYLKEKHNAIRDGAMGGVLQYTKFCIKDITNTGISPNFCGLLAMKVLEDTGKTSCCYMVNNGIAKGSFRGLDRSVDYRAIINSIPNCKAEGHQSAFGFEISVDYIADVMNYVVSVEKNRYGQPFMTIGPMFDDKKGICHYETLDQPKREQLIYKIALINSKMLDNDSLMIVCANIPEMVKFVRMDGKVYIYDVYGLECKGFEEMRTPFVEIYAEYRRGMECYVRTLKDY